MNSTDKTEGRGMVNNVIVISDLHAGCQLGLCPDEVHLDSGGSYKSSFLQKKVMAMWGHFWDEWVIEVSKGEPFDVIMNGDAIDGDHHNAKTQITHNLNDQIEIAYTLLAPIVNNKMCRKYFHVRGTEAHVGKSGEFEELLAKKLNAIPDSLGNYARWELWLEIGKQKALCHFSHHIGATGSSSYESTAVYKELIEAFNEAGRWNDKPPSLVCRSHRHRQFEIRIPTASGYGITLVTPGWQLKTPYVHRLPSGRASTPQIGGYLIRSGDKDGLYTRFKVWRVERPTTEIA